MIINKIKDNSVKEVKLTGDLSGIGSNLNGIITINTTVNDNSHSHTIGNVTNLSTELDGIRTDISEVEGVLVNKADTQHTHKISDVKDLQSRLDSIDDEVASAKNIGRYSEIYVKNNTSTYADAPEDEHGMQLFPDYNRTNVLQIVAGNNIVHFDAVENSNLDQITLTVLADPEGSADAALEDAKSYTNTQINSLKQEIQSDIDELSDTKANKNELFKYIEAPDGESYDANGNGIMFVNGNGINIKISDKSSDADITIENTGVTGIKGDNETSYRTGDVNITPANLGLGNVLSNIRALQSNYTNLLSNYTSLLDRLELLESVVSELEDYRIGIDDNGAYIEETSGNELPT